jgi:Flp pilus assembly protein TadD
MELTIEQALQQGVAAHKEGRLQEAERLYRAILQSQPQHPDANHNLGVLAVSVNKAEAALPLFKMALEANPRIEQFWLSYIDALIKKKQFENAKQVFEQAKTQGVDGEKLNSLKAQLSSKIQNPNTTRVSPPQEQLSSLLEHYQNGQFNDAEKLAISITNEFPTHQFAWKVLGAVLVQLSRISESVVAKEKAVQLAPNDAEAHNNLGNTLQELGRLDEAEASCRQAIALKPDYAEAHSNLGIALHELGRLDEAEASCLQSIALKPDYAEAHYNLGNTLKELGRLDEAEASYTQAIALKPDYAEAYSNMGVVLYISGDIDSALVSMKKANSIDSNFDTYKLFYSVIQAKKSRKEIGVNAGNVGGNVTVPACGLKLTNKPLILTRLVERELITVLLQMNSRNLDRTKDARYGNGRCSSDFNLFEEDYPIIRTVAEDLTNIIKSAVKSDIYLSGTFFNILSAGGGSNPHNHLKEIDGDYGLFLGRQKYSLVYYLAVGDQNCDEPGTLKLFDPNEDILPYEGMITIIPAGRKHSAVYGGKTDRIMIGVNFYSL